MIDQNQNKQKVTDDEFKEFIIAIREQLLDDLNNNCQTNNKMKLDIIYKYLNNFNKMIGKLK